MNMIKLTQEELSEKLRLHRLWLEGADGGVRLEGAYDLRSANLSYADLRSANLSYANLRYADLSSADLSSADLSSADLRSANLRSADLSYADLRSANLSYANLRYADLSSADLSYADLRSANNIPYIPLSCPSHGAFTAWKKVDGYIIRLEIPEDANRCSATSNKCRCDKAKVVSIENMDDTDSGLTEITNENYATCVYRVGEMVYPDSFDDNRWNECSHGIHFFINREDAVRY